MLFTEDATYYAEQVKNKRYTVEDLTLAAIENIEQSQEALNAVNHLQKEEAISVAKKLDSYLANISGEDLADLPPFFGVPILLKDLTNNQAGQPATSSSKLLKDSVAQQTDTFVEDIQKAGFVIVGRTNAPEFGFKGISDSAHFGSVNSPLDLNRNPGGSSGGAAAALSAGLVPLTIGSDGGGSIRIPASYSGLIGLKPTRGRVAVGPTRFRGWQGAAIDFALTKSTRDTFSFLSATQADNFDSPFMVPKIESRSIEPLSSPLKIAYTLDSKITPISKEAKETVMHTVRLLEDLGHELVEVDLPLDNQKAMENYAKMNAVETASMFDKIEKGLGREIQKTDIEPMSFAMREFGKNILGYEYSQMISEWDAAAYKMEQFHQEYDLLLTATTTLPAPTHEEMKFSQETEETFNNFDQLDRAEQERIFMDDFFTAATPRSPYAFLFNLTGQPAISLPLYENEEGLPIGSHFAAGKGQEYLLLQLSKQLEENGSFQVKTHEIR